MDVFISLCFSTKIQCDETVFSVKKTDLKVGLDLNLNIILGNIQKKKKHNNKVMPKIFKFFLLYSLLSYLVFFDANKLF